MAEMAVQRMITLVRARDGDDIGWALVKEDGTVVWNGVTTLDGLVELLEKATLDCLDRTRVATARGRDAVLLSTAQQLGIKTCARVRREEYLDYIDALASAPYLSYQLFFPAAGEYDLLCVKGVVNIFNHFSYLNACYNLRSVDIFVNFFCLFYCLNILSSYKSIRWIIIVFHSAAFP